METKNIGSRIKELRVENHLSQVELAREIDLSQSILSQIENNQVSVSIDVLVRISKRFNIRSEWLIYGKQEYVKMLQEYGFIPMFDSDVVAGYLKDPNNPELIHKLQHYKIPGFSKGAFRIFQLEGHSMVPTLSPDDQIVCSHIENLQDIGDGMLVVVVTDKDALVKRIYHSNDNPESYILKSDNGDFKEYHLKKEEIRELWKVEAKITKSFVDSSFAHITRVDTLEKDLLDMKGQMKSILEEVKSLKNKDGRG